MGAEEDAESDWIFPSRGEEGDVSLALGGPNIRTSRPKFPLESLSLSLQETGPVPRVCRLFPPQARDADGFRGGPIHRV